MGRRKIAKKIAKNKRCYANTLRPRSRMLLKGDEGGLGGHYPLGHLRRGGGSISALRVTGDPAKGDPGGEAPRPRPPPPSFTGVIFVTGNEDLPLATQRRVSLQSPAAQRRCRSLRRDRPLKIQRKNSGSGNKCLRAIGTTTRSLRNWVRSAKKSHLSAGLIDLS